MTARWWGWRRLFGGKLHENTVQREVGKHAALGMAYGAAGMSPVPPQGKPSQQAGNNPNVGAPQQGTRGKPSDQRFRSFAERYLIARAHLFRVSPNELAEDTWQCILDAKTAYNLIARTGQNIEPEDGAGF